MMFESAGEVARANAERRQLGERGAFSAEPLHLFDRHIELDLPHRAIVAAKVSWLCAA